ncbi:hypothetical protein M8J77_018815 [Diaphorina citri]|nr:hypothetical protein M8J77_018815 [Diaphorina citri]
MSIYAIGSYVEISRAANWNAAVVVDADDHEDEIFVKYIANDQEEWVNYKTTGVRKIDKPTEIVKPKPKETPIASLSVPAPTSLPPPVVEEEVVEPKIEPLVIETTTLQSKYKVGDSVLAAWSKSKNYAARVEAVLPNNEYRVQFEDGLKKIVSEDQMTKEADIIPDPSYPKYTTRHKSIDYNLLQNAPDEVIHKKKKKKKDKLKIKFNFQLKSKGDSNGDNKNEIVTQAEIHQAPNLEIEPDDIDDVHESSGVFDISQPFVIHRKDGTSQYSIPISDPKLPPGWHKHKAFFNHRWQAILINSENRKFFGKKGLMKYCETHNIEYSPDIFDFSYMENSKKRRSLDVSIEKKIKILTPAAPTTPVTPTPPLFSDFNLSISGNYVCPKDDCKKEFRKENLLMMHLKHYHPEFKSMLPAALNVADLAYARTNSMDDNEDLAKPVKKTSGSFDFYQNMTSAGNVKVSPPPPVQPALKIEMQPPPVASNVTKVKEKTIAHPSEVKTKETAKVEEQEHDAMDVDFDFESQITPFEITKKSDDTQKKLGGSTVSNRSGGSSVKEESTTPEKKSPPTSNFVSPPSVKYEKMKKEEVVNCVCGVLEEDGLMIQCDICLCWQHSQCSDIETESEVPEKYICKICKNPPLQRKSLMYAYDQDWLNKGVLPTLDPSNKQYDEEFLRTQNILRETHSITGSLCKLSDSMHNASMKMQIVQEPNHPKLYLWSQCVESDDQKDPQTPDETPKIPKPEAPIDSHECRLNLLAQVEQDYNLMEQKLDELERQMQSVEADSSSLMGNPAHDKPTLQMLLRDLETLRTLAIVN